jgi:hypothetical protein
MGADIGKGHGKTLIGEITPRFKDAANQIVSATGATFHKDGRTIVVSFRYKYKRLVAG